MVAMDRRLSAPDSSSGKKRDTTTSRNLRAAEASHEYMQYFHDILQQFRYRPGKPLHQYRCV